MQCSKILSLLQCLQGLFLKVIHVADKVNVVSILLATSLFTDKKVLQGVQEVVFNTFLDEVTLRGNIVVTEVIPSYLYH